MYKHYLREIHQGLGYFATWMPNFPMELGAVGVVDSKGAFHQATSLEKLIGAQPVVKGTAINDLKYHSTNGVTVTVKAAGAAPIPNIPILVDDAGVAIEFKREHAVLFETQGASVDRIGDVDNVGSELLARADAGVWNADYIIITEIVRAKAATISMSLASDSMVAAQAAAKIGVAGIPSLADASLNLQVCAKRAMGIDIIGQTDLTPLFKAWRVRKGWFSNGKWEPAKSLKERPLEAVKLDDLAGSQ